jgi:putative endonuclease
MTMIDDLSIDWIDDKCDRSLARSQYSDHRSSLSTWASSLQSGASMPQDDRQTLGILGEEIACTELRRRGYEIIERRYRTRYGEIDIVARDQDVTVFVEVKARVGNDFGGGAAAVTGWKQRRIAKMAVDFLARHRLHDRPCRFDVVTVDVRHGVPSVEVFTHAFDSDS